VKARRALRLSRASGKRPFLIAFQRRARAMSCKIQGKRNPLFTEGFSMERTGIEPVTSGLQSRIHAGTHVPLRPFTGANALHISSFGRGRRERSFPRGNARKALKCPPISLPTLTTARGARLTL
jgi:hypothetical protein